MLGALHSLEIQPSPCFPKGYKPRAKQIVPHILFLGWLHRQFSRLSGRYQSHHPHTAALPFRIGGTLSSASIIVQASVCRGALDYGEVQERCKSRVQIESGFGGSRSETCKGEPSASAKAATIRAAAASSLPHRPRGSILPTNHIAAHYSSLHVAATLFSLMALPLPSKLHSQISSWLPALRLNLTQNFLQDLTSNSSYNELHFPSLLYCL